MRRRPPLWRRWPPGQAPACELDLFDELHLVKNQAHELGLVDELHLVTCPRRPRSWRTWPPHLVERQACEPGLAHELYLVELVTLTPAAIAAHAATWSSARPASWGWVQ